MKGPRLEQSSFSLQAGWWMVWEQPYREGPRYTGGWKIRYEPAMCVCSPESKFYPELHKKKWAVYWAQAFPQCSTLHCCLTCPAHSKQLVHFLSAFSPNKSKPYLSEFPVSNSQYIPPLTSHVPQLIFSPLTTATCLCFIFLLLFLSSHWKLSIAICSEFIPTFILRRAVTFLAKNFQKKISFNQILSRPGFTSLLIQ